MKIIPINGSNSVYTCNVYLILGDWKRIEDWNTLVDVGSDPSVIDVIENMNTGLGKRKIDQVVLTHSHSDHTGILPLIRKAFTPKVFAFSRYLEGVDHLLEDGARLTLGDRAFEVIHTPGHSEDSISLYCEEEGALFVGDAPVIVRSTEGSYEEGFVRVLRELCRRRILSIYPGHGDPILVDAKRLLEMSLGHVEEGSKRCRSHPEERE